MPAHLPCCPTPLLPQLLLQPEAPGLLPTASARPRPRLPNSPPVPPPTMSYRTSALPCPPCLPACSLVVSVPFRPWPLTRLLSPWMPTARRCARQVAQAPCLKFSNDNPPSQIRNRVFSKKLSPLPSASTKPAILGDLQHSNDTSSAPDDDLSLKVPSVTGKQALPGPLTDRHHLQEAPAPVCGTSIILFPPNKPFPGCNSVSWVSPQPSLDQSPW